MTDQLEAPRSTRRALLTAAAVSAAGAAAAMAASAAGPAAVLAADQPLLANVDNPTTAATSITQGSADTDALAAYGKGNGAGIQATTEGTTLAGVVGQAGDTTNSPVNHWDLDAGVFGFSGSTTGVGSGVYAEGTYGVWGYGDVGTYGEGETLGVLARSQAGSALHAHVGAPDSIPATSATTAIRATVSGSTQVGINAGGRVIFPNRSGRVLFSSGQASKSVNVAGMTSGNFAFAVVNSNRSGIYVRAVVPAAGKITIYLSKAPSSGTYVSWLVLG